MFQDLHFDKKNLESEMLPQTRAALLPHIIRAKYVTMQDKSYLTDCPELPSIEENGWNLLESGCYIPLKCLALPAPKVILELIKCGCKAGCIGRCSCSINSLPCTPLCKCYSGDCANIYCEGHSNYWWLKSINIRTYVILHVQLGFERVNCLWIMFDNIWYELLYCKLQAKHL